MSRRARRGGLPPMGPCLRGESQRRQGAGAGRDGGRDSFSHVPSGVSGGHAVYARSAPHVGLDLENANLILVLPLFCFLCPFSLPVLTDRPSSMSSRPGPLKDAAVQARNVANRVGRKDVAPPLTRPTYRHPNPSLPLSLSSFPPILLVLVYVGRSACLSGISPPVRGTLPQLGRCGTLPSSEEACLFFPFLWVGGFCGLFFSTATAVPLCSLAGFLRVRPPVPFFPVLQASNGKKKKCRVGSCDDRCRPYLSSRVEATDSSLHGSLCWGLPRARLKSEASSKIVVRRRVGLGANDGRRPQRVFPELFEI